MNKRKTNVSKSDLLSKSASKLPSNIDEPSPDKPNDSYPSKTSEKLEIDRAEQSYPKLKVITLFALVGSIFGAMLMTVGFFAFIKILHSNTTSISMSDMGLA